MEKKLNELNLYQRLLKITEEIEVVKKNLLVSAGKSAYRAVSERDVLDAVKPIEAKYGVYSFPASREILQSEIFDTEQNGYKKTTFFSRIKTVYRFVNVDKPDEFIETTVFSEGIDSADKGSGKAMTYADKYSLMKAYKLSTGDDPDEEASKAVKHSPHTENGELATNEEKRAIIDTCERLKVDTGQILKQAGYKEGKLTKEQASKAMIILMEVEAEQNPI